VVAVGAPTPNFGKVAGRERGGGRQGAGDVCVRINAQLPGCQPSESNTTRVVGPVPDLVFNADPSYGAGISIHRLAGGLVVGFGGTSGISTLFAGAVAIADPSQGETLSIKADVASSHTSAIRP